MMFSRISLMKWKIVFKARTKKRGKLFPTLISLRCCHRKAQKLTNCCSARRKMFPFHFAWEMFTWCCHLAFLRSSIQFIQTPDTRNHFAPMALASLTVSDSLIISFSLRYVDCLMDWRSRFFLIHVIAPRVKLGISIHFWVGERCLLRDVSNNADGKLKASKEFDPLRRNISSGILTRNLL